MKPIAIGTIGKCGRVRAAVLAGLVGVLAVPAAFPSTYVEGPVRNTVPAPPPEPAPETWRFKADLSRKMSGDYDIRRRHAGETPWLSNRISRCFFGPIKRPPFYRDELADDVDYYPDNYLERLAREGVNGLWLTIEFRDFSRELTGDWPEGAQRRLAKLRRTIAKCAKHGIRVWLFCIEPVEQNLKTGPLYRKHPDWIGCTYDHEAGTMCASHPGVQRYISDTVRDIFTAAPGLGGMINISHGEKVTSCLSVLYRDHPCRTDCPRCTGVPLAELHHRVTRAFVRGMREAGSDGRLISWIYWSHTNPNLPDWVIESARTTPDGVIQQDNYETGIVVEQEGRVRIGGDYWLAQPGPAHTFADCARAARSSGRPISAKIQTACSHEIATIPVLPVPGLLYRKFRGMHDLGVTDAMYCWYFGSAPGLMNRAAGELAYEDFRDGEDAFLKRLAAEDWGADAETVGRIWKACSDGFSHYPVSNHVQYYGPFHTGVVWPLRPDIEMRPLCDSWAPAEPAAGDQIGECLSEFDLREVLSLARKMCAETEGIAPDLAALERKYAGNAERMLDLGLVRAFLCHLESARDIFEFYYLRREAVVLSRRGESAPALRALARMKAIVAREKEIARTMKALSLADSRLGFHSEAESYVYSPAYFDWRQPVLDRALARLGEIEAAVRDGKGYPKSELEKTAPTYPARLDANGDLVIEGEAKGKGEITVWTWDVCGTRFHRGYRATPKDGRFRLTIPALEWNGDARLRPHWIQIHQGCGYFGDSWQWPAHPAFKYRWNHRDLLGFYSARLVIDERPAAFRAAEAAVVYNPGTAKTKLGRRWLREALADLTNALARVTGHEPAVYEETDFKLQIANCKARGGESKPSTSVSQPSTLDSRLPVIYLGDTEAARTAGLGDLKLRKADWCVRTVPDKAFLYGRTGMSASYAVSEFCDRHLDYHFYLMDDSEPVVRRPDLAIGVDEIVVRPTIYERSVYTAMMNAKVYPTSAGRRYSWQRRIFADFTDEFEPDYLVSRQTAGGRACHSIFDYLPPEKFFKDRPEWYSMGPDGRRRGVRNSQSQICYTNPEVRDEVFRALVGFIEKDRREHPENPPGVYDMEQMDDSQFLCLCPACRKVIAKYNRTPAQGGDRFGGNRHGGDAGLQLEFVNDIARRIRAKYPDVQLRIAAYVSSEEPPTGIAPEPNVVVNWCDVYSHSDHTLPLETPGHYNMRQADEIRAWAKLTTNLHVWDYMLYGRGDGGTAPFPEVSPDSIAADARFYARIGVPRIVVESEYCEQAFYELNTYLWGVLLAHPDRDVDELVHGFCRVYGKGADDMERAIGLLRTWERTMPAREPVAWHNRFLPWLTRANLERLLAVLESACAKESDAACRARILGPLAETSRRLMLMAKQDAGARAELPAAIDRYRRYAKEWYRTWFFEPRDRERKIANVEAQIEVMTLKFDDIPAQLRGVPEKDLVYVDYHVTEPGSDKPDPLSPRRRIISATRPDEDLRGGFPIQCGVYDAITREGNSKWLKAADVPPDGKYHWFRFGRVHLGPNTGFWFPWSWRGSVPFRNFRILSDGLAEDPNWYDLWISMSVRGPLFDPNSKEPNRIAVDGAILHRQKGP